MQAMRGGGAPGVPPPRDGVQLVAPGVPPPHDGVRLVAWSGCSDIILSSCDSGLCCNVVSIVSGVPPPTTGSLSISYNVSRRY